MIGKVNSSSALATYYDKASAGRIDSGATTAARGQSVSDRVDISEPGRLLSKATFKLPSWQSVHELKSEFSAKLKEALNEAGIESNPPFTITQDVNTGVFSVTGDNPQAAQVQELLNNNDELKMLHHNMQAIASHMPGIEASMKFQREYLATDGAAAIQNVIAKYSRLFYGRPIPHSFTTLYGSEGAVLQMDGRKVA